MYSSRKSEQHKPYKVTKVYDSEMSILKLEEAFRDYPLYDNRDRLFSPQGRVKYYLPRILSIIPHNRPSKEIKRGIVSPLKEKIKKERKSSSKYNDKMLKRTFPKLVNYCQCWQIFEPTIVPIG